MMGTSDVETNMEHNDDDGFASSDVADAAGDLVLMHPNKKTRLSQSDEDDEDNANKNKEEMNDNSQEEEEEAVANDCVLLEQNMNGCDGDKKPSATESSNSNYSSTNDSPLLVLPDDILAVVATAVGVYCEAHSFIHLSRTCRRMNRIMIVSTSSLSPSSSTTTSVRDGNTLETETETGPLASSEHEQQQQQQEQPTTESNHRQIQRSTSKLLPEILRGRGIDTNVYRITDLTQLAMYEAFHKSCLRKDNRIGFRFATMVIASDDGSRKRIETTSRMLRQFHSFRHGSSGDDSDSDEDNDNIDHSVDDGVQVVLDAHCGTPAPPPIAPRFSHSRGCVVRDAILRPSRLFRVKRDRRSTGIFWPGESDDERDGVDYNTTDDEDERRDSDDNISAASERQVTVRAWGQRGAFAAARSDHRYSISASEGKGWVEITFRVAGHDGSVLELPRRPDFYEGLEPYNEFDDDDEEEDWWQERDDEFDDVDEVDSEDEDDVNELDDEDEVDPEDEDVVNELDEDDEGEVSEEDDNMEVDEGRARHHRARFVRRDRHRRH